MKRMIVITMLIAILMISNIAYAADRVSLGFIYGASDGVELIDRTNGSINQVSPTCLDITSKGNLVVTSDLTHEFVAAMKERNILVTPFLSNHWVRSKGRAAIKNTEKLTTQIVDVIEKYELDGINVDIENLTPEDRDGFTEFVRVLREKMPKDKMLTVSVAANPEGKDTGWQGSYDYEKLGQYSDYLFVMAYDEHSQGGMCGPVASLDFVKASIEYTLQFVTKDKIVMGIPLYGRYWKENEEYGGEAVVIGAVPALISKNKGIVKYDKEIGEAKVTFTVNNAKIRSKINGKVLEDGKYTIWYQNEESIKQKLNIVNEYDLLGAGVWALGQEKVEVWEYYKNELNKIPYESLEEVKKREEYEALVVDMSNLEEPEIYPLELIEKNDDENIKNIINKQTNNEMNMILCNMTAINKEENKLIKKPTGVIQENAEKPKLKLKKENIKILHIYRYNKKE
ncbi:MAG: hypothetical protein J6C46_06260 [Clostridia bacterium]|nr:hypothetical protein [Clostridia bacterium]